MAFMMSVKKHFILGKRRYNVKLWKSFTELFNHLPVAAIIDEKILCMHGGLSPDLRNTNQISDLPKPTEIPDSGKTVINSQVYYAISSGPIQTKTFKTLKKTIEGYPLYLEKKLCKNLTVKMI